MNKPGRNRPLVQFCRCPQTNKVIHPNRKSAQQIVWRERARGDNVHAYECPDCGWYHVGHLPGECRTLTRDEMHEALAMLPDTDSRWMNRRRRNIRERRHT